MKDLFINAVAATTYASGVTGVADINSLANGALAFIEDNGDLVDGIAPAITSDKVALYLGRTNEGLKRSADIDRATFSYSKTAYSAPLNRVILAGPGYLTLTTVGIAHASNLTTVFPSLTYTPVAGTTYTVAVMDLEKDAHDAKNYKTYSYLLPAVGASAQADRTSIMAKIVVLINADTNCPATARATVGATGNTGEGIEFIGKSTGNFYAGYRFGVALLDGLTYGTLIEDISETPVASTTGTTKARFTVNGVVTISTSFAAITGAATAYCSAGSLGYGTPRQLTALENECTVYDGNTDALNKVGIYTAATRVETTTYTTYTLSWSRVAYNHPVPSNPVRNTLVIAALSTSATIVTLDIILPAIAV